MTATRQDILDRIVTEKRREVRAIAARAAELRGHAERAGPPRSFRRALRQPEEVTLLAEIKRRSPSAGWIRAGADPADVARMYERGGAAALSVLTDAEFFGGSGEALRAARAATTLPVLRKDFIIDPLQLYEARGWGADAVLLIVRILDPSALASLLGLATELGMDVLVEVHDAGEMERAVAAGALLIGVNNRDLRTFHTDLSTSVELAAATPPEVTLVAESGIRGVEDVEVVGRAGVHAVLVGETLMRAEDPQRAARTLVGVRRTQR